MSDGLERVEFGFLKKRVLQILQRGICSNGCRVMVILKEEKSFEKLWMENNVSLFLDWISVFLHRYILTKNSLGNHLFSVLVWEDQLFMPTICSFLLPRAFLSPKTYIFCCVKLEVGYWKSRETYFQNGCTSLKTPAELYRNCKSKANVTVMRA